MGLSHDPLFNRYRYMWFFSLSCGMLYFLTPLLIKSSSSVDQVRVILGSHSELSGLHSRKTGTEVGALSLTSARARYKSSQEVQTLLWSHREAGPLSERWTSPVSKLWRWASSWREYSVTLSASCMNFYEFLLFQCPVGRGTQHPQASMDEADNGIETREGGSLFCDKCQKSKWDVRKSRFWVEEMKLSECLNPEWDSRQNKRIPDRQCQKSLRLNLFPSPRWTSGRHRLGLRFHTHC